MIPKFQENLCSFLLIAFSLTVIWSKPTNAASQVRRPRGVSLSKASFYNENEDFTCLDGSATVPFRYVNDDYCDCQDGSDEPGTSACPNGSFYCNNIGHSPLVLPSSRVNDGICDCCDGSDEYDSGASCSNICLELGAAAREEAKRQWELENRGYTIKLDYVKQGKHARQGKEERLTALKAEQVEAEAVRSELESSKTAAEEPERAALDRYRLAEQEALKQREEDERRKREGEALQVFDALDTNQDGKLDVSEIQAHPRFDQNGDGTVSEEEAKFFLHSDTEMDRNEFVATGYILMKPYFMKEQGSFKAPEPEVVEHPAEGDVQLAGEDHPQQHPEDDEEEEEGGDHPEEEEIVKPSSVAQETIQYDPETQALIDAATKAREAFEQADRRLRDIEKEIRNLEDNFGKDYGPNEEFQPLEGQCFEYSDREYTYKLCPFDYASQRPKHGGSETRLGSWNSWNGPADDKYSGMKYDKGVQCWNGPQRSALIKVSCGVENELTAVSEPNRCEYEMRFVTPAACKEPSSKPPTDQDLHDEL